MVGFVGQRLNPLITGGTPISPGQQGSRLGRQLLQQSLQARPIVNPLQGIGQLAQAGLGAFLTKQGMDQEAAQAAARQQAIQQMLGLPSAPGTQMAGPGAGPGSAPGAVQPAGGQPNQLAQVLAGPGGQDPMIQQLALQQAMGQQQAQQQASVRRQERTEERDFRFDLLERQQKFKEQQQNRKQAFEERLANIEATAEAGKGPKLSDIAGIRKEFRAESKDFRTARDAFNRVTASGKDPSAAGDLALIFNYMKVLDPGSVVRESEFAQAASTGAFGERIKAAAEAIGTGRRLSQAMRDDFVNRAGLLFNEQLKSQGRLETEFTDIAEDSGVDSGKVIVDFMGPLRPKPGGQNRIAFDAQGNPVQ